LRIERAFPLTAAQWVMVRVCFDGVDPIDLSETDRAIALELFGAVERIPPECRHVLALLKGARIGGTWLASLFILYLGLTCGLDGLALGEIAFGIIVCPDMRLAAQAFRYIAGAVDATPAIARLVVSRTSDSITLRRPDGRTIAIECLPASRGGSATRGRTLFAALLDEASFLRDAESGQITDIEIYRSVVVRVLPGGMVLVVSTAWLESGLLQELIQKNHGHPITALACIAPTLTMRDDERIRTIVEDERQRDQANAEREFDCKPLGGGSSQWVDPRSIAQCVDKERALVMVADRRTARAMAVDTGFSVNSSTAAVVYEEVPGSGRFTLGEIIELKPGKEPLKPSIVCDAFAALARKNAINVVLCDVHYQESVREFLEKRRMGICLLPAGGEGKEAQFGAAKSVISEGRISLPDDARLIRQLREVSSKPKPGGGFAISMPTKHDGSHGDLVSALVGATWAMEFSRLHPRRPDHDPVLAAAFGGTLAFD
jgi:hypothetical protein